MWEQAKGSAARATGIAASCDHDFAFLPAAYHLIFSLTVGFKGGSFDHTEVKKLLVDMDRSIARLDAWGMKERVLFDCAPKRYLIALKDEWGKQAEASKGGGKGGGKTGKVGKGKGGKKQRTTVAEALPEEEEEALEPLPAGHLRVTDWRVFDQRFYGFYTWLEPPMGKDDLKCTLCERPCVRVHRCAASANLRATFDIMRVCRWCACRMRVSTLKASRRAATSTCSLHAALSGDRWRAGAPRASWSRTAAQCARRRTSSTTSATRRPSRGSARPWARA